MSDSTELATLDASVSRNAVEALASGKATVFSTIQGDDFDAKLRVLNAVTDSVAIAEHLNVKIELVDLVVQSVEMTNDDTGEVQEVPRTILIDKSGKAYHAISGGVFRSVETLLGVLGQPSTWPMPVPVKVVKEGSGTRQYFTLRPAK